MHLLQLNILTLNVWGIPFISNDRQQRMVAIAKELSTGKYDIVSLQEVWSQQDSVALQRDTETALPYSHYFHSGVMGAGLLVLSKYPIIGTLFHAWSVNGYFHRIQHADWFGGKGVGLCRILVDGAVVHLYNAHLHAEYDNENDEYKTHRVIQAFDTAQFIETTRGNAVLQILAGDLNTQKDDISYKILLHTSKMRDSCASDALRTNECQRNSYTSKRLLKKNPLGIRIDHIFVREAEHVKIEIVDHLLAFPERIPGTKISYSDHEAVLAKLKMCIPDDFDCGAFADGFVNCKATQLNAVNTCAAATVASVASVEKCRNHILECIQQSPHKSFYCLRTWSAEDRTSALEESIALCESSLKQLKIDRILYYGAAFFLFLLLIVLVELSVPLVFRVLFILLKFIIFAIIIYFIFMASIWNLMERNGVLSGKSSMETMLHFAKKYDYRF